MAQLILTEEEKAAQNWLDCDDETIGKMVKYLAVHMVNVGDIESIPKILSAFYVILGDLHERGIDQAKMVVKGHSVAGVMTGDWEMIVQKLGADTTTDVSDMEKLEKLGNNKLH